MSLADIANLALSHNGEGDGQGYAVPTPWNRQHAVADCACFASDMAAAAGYILPNWGRELVYGGPAGFQYVPTGWYNAHAIGATVPSWQAPVGSFALFNWHGSDTPIGQSSHIEVVTGYSGGVLYTCGADSGPSNIDGYRGRGGVHRHAWSAPVGVGNNLIQGIVLPDRIAVGTRPQPTPPPAPQPNDPAVKAARYRGFPLLKAGASDHGAGASLCDPRKPVTSAQNALNIVLHHESAADPFRLQPDGEFGAKTDTAVRALQNTIFNRDGRHPAQVDGQIGNQTWQLFGYLLTAMGR